MPVWSIMPPAQYVHKPNVPVIEMRMTMQELHQLCHAPSNVLACSFFGHREGHTKQFCFIVLPTGTTLNIKKLRIHETAHCNGWPAGHPGGHMDIVG